MKEQSACYLLHFNSEIQNSIAIYTLSLALFTIHEVIGQMTP